MVEILQDVLVGVDALHSAHAANENDNMRPEKKTRGKTMGLETPLVPSRRQWGVWTFLGRFWIFIPCESRVLWGFNAKNQRFIARFVSEIWILQIWQFSLKFAFSYTF